jgi:hypothetical protein
MQPNQLERSQKLEPDISLGSKKVCWKKRAPRFAQECFSESAFRTLRHVEHAVTAIRRIEPAAQAAIEENRIEFGRVEPMKQFARPQIEKKRLARIEIGRR